MSQSIHTWPLPSHPKCKPCFKILFPGTSRSSGITKSVVPSVWPRLNSHNASWIHVPNSNMQCTPFAHASGHRHTHTHANTRAHLGVTHPPRSRALFSSGRGRARGYTAAGCRAAGRGSTCCAPSGWCRRGAAAGSARCGAGSRSSRRSWCSAPTPRPPSCSAGRGGHG